MDFRTVNNLISYDNDDAREEGTDGTDLDSQFMSQVIPFWGPLKYNVELWFAAESESKSIRGFRFGFQ